MFLMYVFILMFSFLKASDTVALAEKLQPAVVESVIVQMPVAVKAENVQDITWGEKIAALGNRVKDGAVFVKDKAVDGALVVKDNVVAGAQFAAQKAQGLINNPAVQDAAEVAKKVVVQTAKEKVSWLSSLPNKAWHLLPTSLQNYLTQMATDSALSVGSQIVGYGTKEYLAPQLGFDGLYSDYIICKLHGAAVLSLELAMATVASVVAAHGAVAAYGAVASSLAPLACAMGVSVPVLATLLITKKLVNDCAASRTKAA